MLFQEIPSVYGASKYDQRRPRHPVSEPHHIHRRSKNTVIVPSPIFFEASGAFMWLMTGTTVMAAHAVSDIQRITTTASCSWLMAIALMRTSRSSPHRHRGHYRCDLIDRVEIIRGSGSLLYGSNAFFAVVIIITKCVSARSSEKGAENSRHRAWARAAFFSSFCL